MQMSADFAFLLFFFTMAVFKAKTVNFVPINCGSEKILNDTKGIIQTPNFPNAFTVPIRCRWVISIPHHLELNVSVEIFVYFTQLFVSTGLNITAYNHYEEGIGYTGNNLLELTSVEAALDSLHVHTKDPYVVIDFEMDILEGNHLRVLHHFMNVFGFNITYEIITSGFARDSCSVLGCSMVGNCYTNIDFSEFKCSCFEGFFGSNCGHGPLCQPGKTSCANGATCRYAGETDVICECTDDFKGPKCDIPADSNQNSVSLQCPYDIDDEVYEKQLPCNCDHIEYVRQLIDDRVHYFLTVKMINTTVYPRFNTKHFMENRIFGGIEKKLREAKVAEFDSLEFINTTIEKNFSYTMNCHFHAARSNDDEIKNILNTVLHHYGDHLTYTLQIQAALQLLTVSANINPVDVREGEEFILTCKAQGSTSLSFYWYKDGVPINVTLATRGMWFHVLPDTEYRKIGLLGIERAELYDSGNFTCQVRDWQLQQCRSISIFVTQTSRIKIRPLNVIANRGQNVSILCHSKNQRENSPNFGYTWVKNGELVKMNVPYLYYEDLYQRGSILHINNVQKSEIYTCNSASVRVDVLDKDRTPFCEKDGSWPTTGAGVTALQECPENYSEDAVRRLCMMVDEHRAEWQLPDYSDCVSNTFTSLTENFHKITLGYENVSVTAADTLNMMWLSLRTTRNHKLHPGEGEYIVNFLHLVYEILTRKEKRSDFQDSMQYFFKIIDLLLQDSTSILNQQTMIRLSYLIEKWTSYDHDCSTSVEKIIRDPIYANSNLFKSFEFYKSQANELVVKLQPNISVKFDGRISVDSEYSQNSSANYSIVIYKNLSHLLLSKYSLNQWENKELMFELFSPVIHVLLYENTFHRKRNENFNWFQLDIEFQLFVYKTSSPIKLNVCCGIVSGFGHSWNLDMCESITLNSYKIRCSCNHSGMFAVFVAEVPTINYETNRKYHIVVIIGCVFCFLQCFISFCVLFLRWFKMSSCLLYLKMQVCVSTASAMLLFLYGSNDPSTDTFPYILSGLQMFLLASVLSHISILIVMYIDILSLKKIPNIKISTILVMTVSPVLLIVFAPLSRKITNEKLTCWWLCKGTLLFYIHFIVGLFFLLLFVFLYYNIMKKLFFLWNSTKTERAIIIERTSFLHQSSIIFLTTIVMVICSIFYINIKTSTSQCIFGSSCALLGLVIFICYVPKNRVSPCCLKTVFSKSSRDETLYSPELQVLSTPTNILQNNESYKIKSVRTSHSEDKSENVRLNTDVEEDDSSIRKTEKKNSAVSFNDSSIGREIDESVINIPIIDNESSDHEIIELNNQHLIEKEAKRDSDILWPVTQNNYISTSSYVDGTRCCSPLHQSHPEILTTRVCVELGVVKNSCDSTVPGDNASTVVICSVDVEPCPGHIVEVNEVKFTTNTIGMMCSDNAQKLNEECSTEARLLALDKTDEEKTDVLDRISQDLDYLLNRPTSSTDKRNNLRMISNGSKITLNSVNKAIKPKM